MNGRSRLWIRLGVLALAVGWIGYGLKTPDEQQIELVLGRHAPEITEIALQIEEANDSAQDSSKTWQRQATLQYDLGSAPPNVARPMSLPNGLYEVSIAVRTPAGVATTKRTAELRGGTTRFDLDATMTRFLKANAAPLESARGDD